MRLNIFEHLPKLKRPFYSKTMLPSEHGCMLWNGAVNSNGYGHIKLISGETFKASRASYAIHYGRFDLNLDVCHKCDNPLCVSPEHLFVGTAIENMQDCLKKGRLTQSDKRGSHNGQSKLTDLQVSDIKIRLKKGESCSSIGRVYGVSHAIISNIKLNKNWTHIQGYEHE